MLSILVRLKLNGNHSFVSFFFQLAKSQGKIREFVCVDFLKFLETDIFVAGSASAINASLEPLVNCARRAGRAEARPAAACTSELHALAYRTSPMFLDDTPKSDTFLYTVN